MDFNKGNVVIVSLKLLLYNDKKKTSANLWHWKICGILKLITLKRFEDNLKGVEHLFQKPRFHCKGYSYITEVIEEAATVKIDVVSLLLMAYMKHISCYL